MANWKMKMMPQERWGAENLMYITKTNTLMDAAQSILDMNETHLKSDQVTQDVLILTGAEDHFIPLKMHHLQVNALIQAQSVTARIFTVEDHAQNHCQVGNFGLALNVMAKWIAEKEPVYTVS